MANPLAGTRIREQRRAVGLRQSALADGAGISASYLNLIEHNKRNPPERVLARIADALNMPISALRDGAESSLLSDLRTAASNNAAQQAETDRAQELASRFPGWAQLIATQVRQMRDQAATVAALTDRMNYDPRLQATLHEMLTNITAIRSTAGILATESDIPPNQQRQFQDTIHSESIRLSDAAGSLVAYLDRAEEGPKDAATPQEAFEQFLEKHDHVFEPLEENAATDAVSTFVSSEPLLADEEARLRARYWLNLYRSDAGAMPFAEFIEIARKSGFSPEVLSKSFDVSILAVFRRLATLARKGVEAPRFGLVVINAAGQPLYRRRLPGFSLPRFTSICALWPVFQALSVPGHPLENLLIMPDGSEFLARSIAVPLIEAGFGETPHYASGMLVTELNEALAWGMIDRNAVRPRQAVGTSCRLCQREDCAARAEPSLFPETA